MFCIYSKKCYYILPLLSRFISTLGILQQQQGDQSQVYGVTFADHTTGTRLTFRFTFALISRFISTPGITPAAAVAGRSVPGQYGVTFADQTTGTRLARMLTSDTTQGKSRNTFKSIAPPHSQRFHETDEGELLQRKFQIIMKRQF